MKLYVGNLAYSVTDCELRDAFAAHVGVSKAEVVMDKAAGKSKGFGFVELITAEDAHVAIEMLDGSEMAGRKIRVQAAKPRKNGNGGRLY